jgi:ABC-type phosphate transport system auxiliary subunit
MATVQDLKNKEEQIRNLQTKKSRLEGRKSQLEADLLSKFGVHTVEEGDVLLADKKKELDVIDDSIQDKMNEMSTIIGASQNDK